MAGALTAEHPATEGGTLVNVNITASDLSPLKQKF